MMTRMESRSTLAASGDLIAWGDDKFEIHIRLDDELRPRLVHCGPPGALPIPLDMASPPVELEIRGAAKGRGFRHIDGEVGARLRYVSHAARPDRLDLVLTDPDTGLGVTQVWRRYGAIPVVRCHVEIRNDGSDPLTVDYVSSFVLTGFGSSDGPHWTDRVRVSYASMDTCAEFQWRTYSPRELGIVDVGFTAERGNSTRRRIGITSVGSTSSGEFLPAGALTDTRSGMTWAWQIEHNGAWHWEIGDRRAHAYLAASGPTDQEHQWHITLHSGESFESVPVAITAHRDGLPAALASLTDYRRAIRRPHPDNETLPVVFNDYMNCLWAQPTEEKLLPLIDAAARAGCEVFCIDAGWYSDELTWWDSVGEWLPAPGRFPSGLPAVLKRIAAEGMVPGLWMEPEVVGVHSPVAERLPFEAFFVRGGHRVNERGRYQLDLRHPAARAHLDATVDRLVGDYGVGYLKFDYNINIGTGTDQGSDGPGAGLLGHNRAYLRWVESLLDRHSGLVIESCAGGGARLDYATLSVHSIQSTSDQANHLTYVPIVAAAATAITPEQAGIWVYPQPELSLAETHLCVVNGLLGRMHVSGRPDLLSAAQFAALAEGIDVHKGLRELLPRATPVWPTGLPEWTSPWISYGVTTQAEAFVAVWRRAGENTTTLALPHLRGLEPTISCVYPPDAQVTCEWNSSHGTMSVTLPTAPSACLLRLGD